MRKELELVGIEALKTQGGYPSIQAPQGCDEHNDDDHNDEHNTTTTTAHRTRIAVAL